MEIFTNIIPSNPPKNNKITTKRNTGISNLSLKGRNPMEIFSLFEIEKTINAKNIIKINNFFIKPIIIIQKLP